MTDVSGHHVDAEIVGQIIACVGMRDFGLTADAALRAVTPFDLTAIMAYPVGLPPALLHDGLNGISDTGAMDAYLRAFNARTGEELWQGRLPVPGVANPMTYLWKGEQYVAIGAGGHSESGTTIGDSVVAFRLPRAGEAPSLWSPSSSW